MILNKAKIKFKKCPDYPMRFDILNLESKKKEKLRRRRAEKARFSFFGEILRRVTKAIRKTADGFFGCSPSQVGRRLCEEAGKSFDWAGRFAESEWFCFAPGDGALSRVACKSKGSRVLGQ